MKVVFRHLAFLGQESLWAAEAAECAGEQGHFWAYHDRLFAEQAGRDRGAFAKPRLQSFAADLRLQTEAFNTCLDSGRYVGRVQADTEDGIQKGVAATPTLFVNDRKLEGVPSFDTLRQIIEGGR